MSDRRVTELCAALQRLREERDGLLVERDELVAQCDELLAERDDAECRLELLVSLLIDRAIKDERGGPVRRVIRDLDELGL